MKIRKNTMKKSNPIIAEDNSKKYSIHTMTFRARLTKESSTSIKEKLIKLSNKEGMGYYEKKSEDKAVYKTMNFNVASCFGFNTVSLLKITSKNRDTFYWMDIKINPRWMFHKDNHPFVYIASKKDLKSSYKRIAQFLEASAINEISSEAFYIQRADYCVNIDLGSQDCVKEYMRLMKKGAYPYNAERKEEYSKSGKRKVPTKDSFTVGSNSFEFSIYDKYRQLCKETDKYAEGEIREAEGMIRIELRVKRPKIKYDGKKGRYNNTLEFLSHAGDIAEDNIPRYIKKAYGSGKFVKLKEAKQMIENSKYKKKTKEKMTEILDKVSKSNLQEVKQSYGKSFSKHMKRFNDLGISPVTIEKRSRIKEFPGPLYFIEYKNKSFCL